MNDKIYLDFIKTTAKVEGYKVADIANKKALEMKKITLDQYQRAARFIVYEYLRTR